MRIDAEDKTEEELADDLKLRLQTAEKLLLALKGQLESYASSGGGPDAERLVKSETEARTELTKALEKLEKLEKIFGADSDPELRNLAEKLKEREEALKVAEAQMKSHEAVRPNSRLVSLTNRDPRSDPHGNHRLQTRSMERSIDCLQRGQLSTSRMPPRFST